MNQDPHYLTAYTVDDEPVLAIICAVCPTTDGTIIEWTGDDGPSLTEAQRVADLHAAVHADIEATGIRHEASIVTVDDRAYLSVTRYDDARGTDRTKWVSTHFGPEVELPDYDAPEEILAAAEEELGKLAWATVTTWYRTGSFTLGALLRPLTTPTTEEADA